MLLFFLRGRKDPGILERDRQRIRIFAGWGGRHGERTGECVSGTAEILFPGDRNREDRGVEDLA